MKPRPCPDCEDTGKTCGAPDCGTGCKCPTCWCDDCGFAPCECICEKCKFNPCRCTVVLPAVTPYNLPCGCYLLLHPEDPGGVGCEEMRCATHSVLPPGWIDAAARIQKDIDNRK